MRDLPALSLISCCQGLNIFLVSAYFKPQKISLNVFEDAGKEIHINMHFISFV